MKTQTKNGPTCLTRFDGDSVPSAGLYSGAGQVCTTSLLEVKLLVQASEMTVVGFKGGIQEKTHFPWPELFLFSRPCCLVAGRCGPFHPLFPGWPLPC